MLLGLRPASTYQRSIAPLGQRNLAAIPRFDQDIRPSILHIHMDSITLATLAAFPEQLEAHYGAIPHSHKHWKPNSWEGIPSEHLTAIEQLCHVRDIEIEGYQLRFQRTLKEENPLLGSLDTDALARDREYHKQDAARVLAEFREARARTVEMFKGLNPEQLSRKAEFEGYGQTTLKGLIHYLCSHDQQHLAGLQWLAGKIQIATS